MVDDGWELVRQVPADAATGTRFELHMLRLVSSLEHERILADQRMFLAFTGSWGWNRLIGRMKDYLESVGLATTAASKSGGAVNSADASRIDETARAFVREVEDWLCALEAGTANELKTSAPGLEAIRARIASITLEGSPTTVCRQLAVFDGPITALTAADNGETNVVLTSESSSFAGAMVPEGEAVSVNQLLVLTISAVEQIASTILAVHEGVLIEAGSRLLSLFAEILVGEPALIPSSQADGYTTGKQRDLSLEQIQIGLVQPIIQAVWTAKARLAAEGQAKTPGPTADSPQTPGSGQPMGPSQKGRDREPDSQSTDQAAAHGDSQAARQTESGEGGAPDSSQNNPANPREVSPSAACASDNNLHRVADFNSLLDHVGALTDETEKAWSEALGIAAFEIVGQLSHQWASFLSAVQQESAALLEDLRGVGDSTMISHYPPTIHMIESLSLVPTHSEDVLQTQLALLHTLDALARAVRSMQEPLETSFDVGTGFSATWWEAGAFAHVRASAAAVVRSINEMRLVAPHAQGSQGEDNRSAENVLAEDGMPAKPGAHYPSDWTEKVRLAGAACHAGLYEAALVYAASAVRKIVAVATGGQDRPDNAYVAFALSRSPAIAPFVPATALLLEAAEMVGKGVPVRLGVSAPLATFWASILPAWVRDDVPGRLTPDISNTNAPEPSEPQ